jgi:Nucleotide-sugar transporter
MMKDDDEETPLTAVNADGTDEIIPSKSSPAGDAKQRGVRKTRVPRDPTKRKPRLKKDENAAAIAIKYAALVLLVAQMVGLVFLMHYSRIVHNSEEPLYLASTAVFVMEVMKLVICFGVIAHQSGGQLLSELKTHILYAPMEMLKLSVPSFLYTVQNNLLYLALTNLDAATYQVCYQLKILTTAVFSMILLQVRPLTRLRRRLKVLLNHPFPGCSENSP